MPCAIGRGGVLAAKREGDGATPAGTHRIVAVLARHDRVRYPGQHPGPRDIWSDDPADPLYNRPAVGHPGHRFSHERLHRADRLYDLVAVLDHNWAPVVPGGGSAVFLHVWRRARFPTAGCVALRLVDLGWVLARWTARSRVVIRARGGL